MEDVLEQNVLFVVRVVRYLEKRLEEVFILILLVGFYQLFNECKDVVVLFEFLMVQFLWILWINFLFMNYYDLIIFRIIF